MVSEQAKTHRIMSIGTASANCEKIREMILLGLNSQSNKLIFLTPFPANKMKHFVHSTMSNAPGIHPRLDSILELCKTFPNEQHLTLNTVDFHG